MSAATCAKRAMLLVALAAFCQNANGVSLEQTYCADLRPQVELDMSHIMGMWHGVEVISHLRDGGDISAYDSCPVLHLTETTYEQTRGTYSRDEQNYYSMSSMDTTIRPGSHGYRWTNDPFSQNSYRSREYRHLRLLWEESGNDIEYYLKFNNTRKGFWISSGPQHGSRGTLLQRQYNQFAGTVQVIKAVGDHLVLTFCQRLPDSSLFTIILSRERDQLSRHDIYSIHDLLNRKNLQALTTRKVCNGCLMEKGSYFSIIIFTIISIITHFKRNIL